MNELKRTYNKAKNLHKNMKSADFAELVALNMDMVNINTKMKNSTKNKLYLDTCKEILSIEGDADIYHSGFLMENENLCNFYMAIKSAAFLPYPEQPFYMERLERELFMRLFGTLQTISENEIENPEYVYEDVEGFTYLSDMYGIWSEDTKHDYFKSYVKCALEDIKANSSFKEAATNFTK